MKKLYFKIFLLTLPVFLVIILIPVDKRYKYLGLVDDCTNRGIWIYDRIYNNSASIDFLFLGSSKTINGIDDKLIKAELERHNINKTPVNLAYCRFGRNLSYILLKEVLHKKEINTLILEIGDSEDRFSNLIFPFVANPSDVFFPPLFINHDYFDDIHKHTTYKLQLLQEKLFNIDTLVPTVDKNFGVLNFPNTSPPEFLAEIRDKRYNEVPKWSKLEGFFSFSYARTYLNKIQKLCAANSIDLVFIYIPGIGKENRIPAEMKKYEEMGRVLFPPKEIFTDLSNWVDENHLNSKGATIFSEWISEQIIKHK